MMAADGTASTPWRVLIVDDEENLNWSLVTSLRKDGFIVDGAHTGEEALDRLQVAPYDCVVSDIKMPGMDGFELLQWLRQHHPATRMVMITSFGSPSARQDALREGAVAFFEKPFDLRALKDQLHRMSGMAAHTAPPEAGYDLLDVAQVINLARRDIALDVRGGGHTGVLRFLQGELVWAEAGDLRGDEAFLALCVPRGGYAQVAAWNGVTGRNVTQPVARLIYAALARRDGRTGAPARMASAAPAPAATPYTTPDYGVVSDEQATSTPAAEGVPPRSPVEATPPDDGVAVPPVADEDAASGVPAAPSDDASVVPVPVPTPTPAAEHPPMPTPSLPSSPLEDQPDSDPTAALETLVNALPVPCGVAWIGTDTGVVWQRWREQAEIPQPALAQLHAVVRAAGQASALGELGTLDELRIATAGRQLILRRGPRGGTLLLSLAPDADASAVAEALRGALSSLAG